MITCYCLCMIILVYKSGGRNWAGIYLMTLFLLNLHVFDYEMYNVPYYGTPVCFTVAFTTCIIDFVKEDTVLKRHFCFLIPF